MDNQVVRFPFKNQSECRMPVGSDYPTGPGWQARSSFGGAKGVACPRQVALFAHTLLLQGKERWQGLPFRGGANQKLNLSISNNQNVS